MKLKEDSFKTIEKDYLRVIRADEIGKFAKPPFPWKGHTEQQYRFFLEKYQTAFGIFEENNSGYKAENDILKDISQSYKEQKDVDTFENVFLDYGSCVFAQKNYNGKYQVCSGGFHRMYVAKKYGLKLLVRVMQEKSEY